MKQAVEDIGEKVNNGIYKRDPSDFQVINNGARSDR